jgi:hypothetical protein
MIDKLKTQRRGYVVILVMVIALVAKLSPGMAMPMSMNMVKATPLPVDDRSMIDLLEESRSIEKMQTNTSGCHSGSHATTGGSVTPSRSQITAISDHTVNSAASVSSKTIESMVYSEHNAAPDSCCDTQCQCPAGACSAVYAMLNNDVSVAVIARALLLTFVSHQAPNTQIDTQFRPPKFAFAG